MTGAETLTPKRLAELAVDFDHMFRASVDPAASILKILIAAADPQSAAEPARDRGPDPLVAMDDGEAF